MMSEVGLRGAHEGQGHPEPTDGAFRVVPGDPASRVLVHVPHASTVIPGWVREGILLSDEDLLRELAEMTDARTDEIALSAANLCGVRPWLFINAHSRLVIDPERFPDPNDEVMATPEIGMGAVYNRTSDQQVLRVHDPARDATLLETFFRPYSVALADLVAERLEATSSVTIIDLHSFPQVELPYERLVHPGAPRPACCIGTDEHHTPEVLVEMVQGAFARIGECQVNKPFAGTYVPLRFYKSDRRVSSVMVELRRDSYQQSPADLDAVGVMLTSLISDIQSKD